MIDRICISINNRCNLACSYCHFHEKGKIEAAEMDVYEILNNVKKYAEKKRSEKGFKIGFVGNGECFLDWQALKSYIACLEDAPRVRIYTITNGTVRLPEEDLAFLEEHRVNVGFSIDGYKELHDKYHFLVDALEFLDQYRKLKGEDLLAIVGGSFGPDGGASYVEIANVDNIRRRNEEIVAAQKC